tara:strand:- start:1178 stop:1672 length:495 start_codon:yes stop_codon:yes gene_type:complete
VSETLILGNKSYSANLRRSGSNFKLEIGEDSYDGDFERLGNGSLSIVIDGQRHICYSERKSNETYVFADGKNFVLRRQPRRTGSPVQEEKAEDLVLSPITGKLLDCRSEEGASVKEGDVVIVLEAMKMEHRLRSPRDGIISKITPVQTGGQVKEGEMMFELEDK